MFGLGQLIFTQTAKRPRAANHGRHGKPQATQHLEMSWANYPEALNLWRQPALLRSA